MHPKILIIAAVSLMLAACGSTPTRTTPSTPASAPSAGGYLSGDGPDANAPADIDATPDAIPRAEPLHRYANRPYKALGKEYTPLTSVGSYKERGTASWYGKKFHGQHTSIGETYDMYAMSAAHTTLPVPSYARVTRISTGKSVIVRINDRGPFMHDRIIDLSYTAAHKLGITGSGSAEVEVESLTPDAVTSPVETPEPVQSTPLETPTVTVPVTTASSVAASAVVTTAPGRNNVYLQLGAFKTETSAKQFLAKMRHKLGNDPHKLVLLHQGGVKRVQIGPYDNTDEARNAADKLHTKLGVKPFVSAK